MTYIKRPRGVNGCESGKKIGRHSREAEYPSNSAAWSMLINVRRFE